LSGVINSAGNANSPLFPTIHLTSLIIHHEAPTVNTFILLKISKKNNKKTTYQQVACKNILIIDKK
jgi:hypothetical protein